MKLTINWLLPMNYVYSFAVAVVAAAVVEGTGPIMAFGLGFFIVVMAMAFNKAGGLAYPSGSYIFFAAVLTVIIGALGKLVLGEPLESNLLAPETSMLVYDAGAVSMYAAAAGAHRYRRKVPLLANLMSNVSTTQVAAGCLFVAIFGGILIPKEFLTTFNQFNNFMVIAVMLPVYERAKETDGKSTFGVIPLIAWAYSLIFFGLLAFSKQGLFFGTSGWILAAVAAGYRISKVRLVVLTALGVFALTFLTPYAQVGRLYRDDPEVLDKAIYLLTNPAETREIYAEVVRFSRSVSRGYNWYDEPQGIMDRLAMFPIDDALIYFTDNGHPQTLEPIRDYFLNAIPRYLYPGKQGLHWGNTYAHEIGMLGPGDFTTGISFSPFADAYHQARWLGITVVASALFFMLFWVCDSVTGPADQSMWALLYIVVFTHTAPEGMLGGTVYGATQATFGVIVGAYACTRLGPLVGALIAPPDRKASAPVTRQA